MGLLFLICFIKYRKDRKQTNKSKRVAVMLTIGNDSAREKNNSFQEESITPVSEKIKEKYSEKPDWVKSLVNALKAGTSPAKEMKPKKAKIHILIWVLNLSRAIILRQIFSDKSDSGSYLAF